MSLSSTMPSLYVKIFNKQTQTYHEAPRQIASKLATWGIHYDRWSDDGKSLTFYGSQDLLAAVLEVAEFGSTNYTNPIILSAKLKELGFTAPVTYKCYYQLLDGSYNLMAVENDKWTFQAFVLDAKIVCKINIKIKSYITYSYMSDTGLTNCEYKVETKKYSYTTESIWKPVDGEEYKIVINSTYPHSTRVETLSIPQVKQPIPIEPTPDPWYSYYHLQPYRSMYDD